MDNHQIVMKKLLAEKRVSLSIEELRLKREEERQYQLTPVEKQRQADLSAFFHDDHPAERIWKAIEEDRKVRGIRKAYLEASKVKHEKEQAKAQAESNAMNVLLIASGLPIAIIGFILMEAFWIPGLVVCVVGACMVVPAILSDVTKKKRVRSELKRANAVFEDLDYRMHKSAIKVDKVCTEFRLPVNASDKSRQLLPLYEAAEEYESLLQKQVDYELFLRISGSDRLKLSVVEDLRLLTGMTVTDERAYPGILEVLDNKPNIGLLKDKSKTEKVGEPVHIEKLMARQAKKQDTEKGEEGGTAIKADV